MSGTAPSAVLGGSPAFPDSGTAIHAIAANEPIKDWIPGVDTDPGQHLLLWSPLLPSVQAPKPAVIQRNQPDTLLDNVDDEPIVV